MNNSYDTMTVNQLIKQLKKCNQFLPVHVIFDLPDGNTRLGRVYMVTRTAVYIDKLLGVPPAVLIGGEQIEI